jgi:hypothetical protein
MSTKKGYRKQRVKRPIEKDLMKGYDSNWEYILHSGLLKEWQHHGDTVDYIVEHKYHPDFIKEIDGKTILLESKGRFWDYQEYNKYVWIKKILPESMELVFLFANPNAAMPQAKRRKDGTKRSHGEWAWGNKFRWFSEESLPSSWIDESYRKSEEHLRRKYD